MKLSESVNSIVGLKFGRGSKGIVKWYRDEYQNGGSEWQREAFNHIEAVELRVAK